MRWTKLLGGVTALGVLAGVVGSLAGIAGQLPTNLAALAGVVVVVAVMAAVVGSGLAGRATRGNPYW